MRNILITGVGGLIGSALTSRLLDMGGLRIVGIVKDRNFRNRPELLKRISVVDADLRDYDAIRYAISHYEIDTVIHLGAQTQLSHSTTDPLSTWQTNLLGTAHVLEACRICKIKKVVVAGSDKGFASAKKLPYTEETPLSGLSDPYSASKAGQIIMAQSYAAQFGMDISITAAGNCYGFDLNIGRLIPGTIVRCLQGKPPVLYRAPDGKDVGSYKREFIFVEDLVDAYITIAEKGGPGELYCVGGSSPITPLEVINKIVKLTGFKGEPVLRDVAFVEIKEQHLDARKLEKLGWSLKHTLDVGLLKTIELFKSYLKEVEDGLRIHPGYP